jgi:hypothetical protein
MGEACKLARIFAFAPREIRSSGATVADVAGGVKSSSWGTLARIASHIVSEATVSMS